jgi:paraquat-inducible protein B
MAARANPAIVGAFVVGALVLLCAGALVLGAGRWFSGDLRFVLSFREAVTGLVVGSPVEFRGVKVGEVAEIRALYDPKANTFYFPVMIRLQPDRFERLGPGAKNVSTADLTAALVERGLRARLETQSFVTGQKRIALDFFPDKVATYAGPEVAYNHMELPTVDSPTEDIANLLRQIPFERLGRDLVHVADGMKRLFGPGSDGEVRPLSDLIASLQGMLAAVESELKPFLKEGRATLVSLRSTAEQARAAMVTAEASLQSIGGAAASVEQTSADARMTLLDARATLEKLSVGIDHARSALANIDKLTGDDSAVLYEITRAARELGSAGRAVRVMADELHARPDTLLRGRTADGAR